jgi:hypothetical protein
MWILAKSHCIGIIKGLWQYEEGSTSDLAELTEDAPGQNVDTVIEERKKGNSSSEVMGITRSNES